MSTYGDRGNVIAIQQRAQWRGINIEVIPYDRDSPADLIHEVDIIAGGGAQDRQQEIVMRDLAGAKATAIKAKLDAGAPWRIYLRFAPTPREILRARIG